LKIIENLKTFDLSITNISSVFAIEFRELFDQEVEIVRRAANQFRHRDCVFVGYKSEQTRLIVFKSVNFSIEFQGNWSNEKVFEFVFSNIECLLPPLTARAIEEFGAKSELILVVFLVPELYESIVEFVQKVHKRFRIFYEVFEDQNWIVQMMEIQRNELPVFAILDTKATRWVLFKSQERVKVRDWIENVDLQSLKWEGPGSGFLEELKARVRALVRTGSWPLYVIAICLSLIVGMCGFMIWDCYRMCRNESRNQKKE
jgi:hypothetical protein